MKQWIIFLRGINVGGRNIKMAELKECLLKGGYSGVQTILQTGNVILESKETQTKVKSKTEKILSDSFAYPAKVLVLDTDTLNKAVNAFPFSDIADDFHKYMVFTEAGAAEDIVKDAPELDTNIERIAAGKNVVYWYVQKGKTLDSIFGKYLSKTASKYLTTNRNLNTLNKILAKLED